eukprot:TRINITY_DN11949_c0_g1_i1.p1 TRINITY_DN11949_c0_g1~~TRINITY_DN11949_c0_g1_i1.p1  ORF type:complete len:105 (-),score=15.57 TRINITY_DN11949_c0_g1_i1:77-364(-)
MSAVKYVAFGALITTAYFTNPNEGAFRDEVHRQGVISGAGTMGGHLLRGLTYIMQKSNAFQYHNFYLFSVVTENVDGAGPKFLAVGAFNHWWLRT